MGMAKHISPNSRQKRSIVTYIHSLKDQGTAYHTGHMRVALWNSMNQKAPREAGFVVLRGWGTSCFLRKYVIGLFELLCWLTRNWNHYSGIIHRNTSSLFDKEDCLAREPYVGQGAEWERELVIRPFKTLLILQDVNAAQKSNFSFPPCENRKPQVKLVRSGIVRRQILKDNNPQSQVRNPHRALCAHQVSIHFWFSNSPLGSWDPSFWLSSLPLLRIFLKVPSFLVSSHLFFWVSDFE